jgi:hypothetical protein
MNILKKFIAISLCFVLPFTAHAAQLYVVDVHKGLQRNPDPDRIGDGANEKFDSAYIRDGNLRVVKGRDKLNSTAHSDTVSNGLFYYENAAGSTKKIIQAESDELVTYDVDGTNRTQIGSSLANVAWDCVQIADAMYCTNTTNGIYKWSGSGSASALGSVSAPSSVDFSATTGNGGLTSGLDMLLTPSIAFDDSCAIPTTATAATGCISLTSFDTAGSSIACGTGDDGVLETCATTTTYGYKITHWHSIQNIESEASSSDSVTLTGDNTFSWGGSSCTPCDQDCGSGGANCNNGAGLASCCAGIEYTTTGKQTRTTGTLASAPSAPWDGFCIYRTVAGGTDYFKVGCVTGGGTAYTDGKPDTGLTALLDTTIDTISPPAFRYIGEYKGVLFAGEGDTVRHTRLPVGAISGGDTYWLDTDKIVTGARTPITGLHTTSNSFLIFTSDRIIEVTGFGFDSFRQKVLVDGIGTVADETIETDNNGDVIFFSGVEGVYKISVGRQETDDLLGSLMGGQSKVTRISSPFMDEVFRGTDEQIDLDPSDYSASHAYFDRDNDLYFLYIGNECFIFDNKNNAWSHIPGTKMKNSVYRKSPNSAGQGVLMDNLGFMWNNWTGYENGVESGTVTGNPTSSANSTLTDSGASFATSGSGLAGAWVIAVDTSGTMQYRRITSNTSTVLTVETNWTSNPATTSTYYVGYIVFDVLTKQYSVVKPPKETEIIESGVVHNKSASTQNLTWSYYDTKSTTANASFVFDLSAYYSDSFGTQVRSKWLQFGMRAFVYNTSNSVVPPVDIISWNFNGTPRQEQ